jgi:hypothetical protein
MDYKHRLMRKNSLWLHRELEEYTKQYSPDQGRTIPHLKCAGHLRHYTSKRFFSRERVECRSEPTTEAFIEKSFDSEPQDEALGALWQIYLQLRERVPSPAPDHEFL